MIAAVIGLAIALVATGFWLLRGRYVVVTVRGESMSPTYRPGDRLLVRRTRAVRRDDCVVFAEEETLGLPAGWVVKRAVAVSADDDPDLPAGHLTVLGDNPAGSYDSRHFGYVTTDRVLGVVLRRMTGRDAR